MSTSNFTFSPNFPTYSNVTFSPNFPSFPTYSSDLGHDAGPPTIFIVFAVIIISSIIVCCVVRCMQASGAIEDPVARPPPVEIVYPTGSHNVYPNHLIDLEGGNYVAMASTPQYEIPMAVMVDSTPATAPVMDTWSTPTTTMDSCSAPTTSMDSCSAPTTTMDSCSAPSTS